MLTHDGCRTRQQRLRQGLQALRLDAAIITDHRDVYYLTGRLFPERLPVFLLLETEGGGWLVSPHEMEGVCVEECLPYEWNESGTNHVDPLRRMAAVVQRRATGAKPTRRLGWQEESLSRALAETIARTLAPDDWVAVDEVLRTLQRSKDPDELELLRRSATANLGAYEAVLSAIRPGATELEVLAAGQRGAMLTAREKVFHDGDYRSGAYNGPARDRPIERGELYIIDAWTSSRGYWSDLSRVFLVGDRPTDLQQSLFDHIAGVLSRAAGMLRPGRDTTEVWRAMDQMIREHPALSDTGLIHHGGHAIGLRIHEEPDVNRDRGGILEPGNVICLEPGGYVPEARHGVRIENTYLITDSGAEILSQGTIELRACS
jgi:Xaa-Pro aminopeptidase